MLVRSSESSASIPPSYATHEPQRQIRLFAGGEALGTNKATAPVVCPGLLRIGTMRRRSASTRSRSADHIERGARPPPLVVGVFHFVVFSLATVE